MPQCEQVASGTLRLLSYSRVPAQCIENALCHVDSWEELLHQLNNVIERPLSIERVCCVICQDIKRLMPPLPCGEASGWQLAHGLRKTKEAKVATEKERRLRREMLERRHTDAGPKQSKKIVWRHPFSSSLAF